MNRLEATSRIRAHVSELAGLGVAHLAVFGSTARDEALEGSDVDVLVEFLAPPTLRQFMGSSSCSNNGWTGRWIWSIVPLCVRVGEKSSSERLFLSREEQLRLRDILDACQRILAWTAEVSFEEFAARGMVYSAVLREFLVIGESIKQLPPELRALAPEVGWREWAGLRDVVVHRYFGLQDATPWGVVEGEVPRLVAAIHEMMRAND